MMGAISESGVQRGEVLAAGVQKAGFLGVARGHSQRESRAGRVGTVWI